RFSRPAEVDLHSVLVSPQVHDLTGELRSVITEKHLRCSALEANLIEHRHDICPLQRLPHFDCQTFSGEYIHDRQRPKPPPIGQLVRYKIQTPRLIRLSCSNPLPWMLRCPTSSFRPLF